MSKAVRRFATIPTCALALTSILNVTLLSTLTNAHAQTPHQSPTTNALFGAPVSMRRRLPTTGRHATTSRLLLPRQTAMKRLITRLLRHHQAGPIPKAARVRLIVIQAPALGRNSSRGLLTSKSVPPMQRHKTRRMKRMATRVGGQAITPSVTSSTRTCSRRMAFRRVPTAAYLVSSTTLHRPTTFLAGMAMFIGASKAVGVSASLRIRLYHDLRPFCLGF